MEIVDLVFNVLAVLLGALAFKMKITSENGVIQFIGATIFTVGGLFVMAIGIIHILKHWNLV